MNTKDEYIHEMHAKLEEWSNDIDALATESETADAQVQHEYHRKIEALRSSQEKISKQLDQLQQSGEEAWEHMKSGIETAWEDFSEALSSARSHFK